MNEGVAYHEVCGKGCCLGSNKDGIIGDGLLMEDLYLDFRRKLLLIASNELGSSRNRLIRAGIAFEDNNQAGPATSFARLDTRVMLL